jgi:hypothetical protein
VTVEGAVPVMVTGLGEIVQLASRGKFPQVIATG